MKKLIATLLIVGTSWIYCFADADVDENDEFKLTSNKAKSALKAYNKAMSKAYKIHNKVVKKAKKLLEKNKIKLLAF